MLWKSTADANFAARMLMEKYREGRVCIRYQGYQTPREELWCCIRKSWIPEKYVKATLDMYGDSERAVSQQERQRASHIRLVYIKYWY